MSTSLRSTPSQLSRRGRLPADLAVERRNDILDAALAELIERGYESATMAGIAQRAGASKETLYAWFTNREGLFQELIERDVAQAVQQIEAALESKGDSRVVLQAVVLCLLEQASDPSSLAIARAAMQSPFLSDQLLTWYRTRVGAAVERHLATLKKERVITALTPKDAFELLYGIAFRDLGYRWLLGEAPLSRRQLQTRARKAVEQFMVLATA